MRRREFIALIGGGTMLPIAARTQQPAMTVIGYFSGRSADAEAPIREPLLRALEESGFVVGRNLAIEYPFAEGRPARLPVLAAELVRRGVVMLIATDGGSALAATGATAAIPIVYTIGFDPVQIGLAASFNRPGGNATGVSLLTTELGPTPFALLPHLLPTPGTIAFVVNKNSTATQFQVEEMQAAAQAVGQSLLVVSVGTEEEVDKAFATMAERNVAAILYAANLFFQVISERLVALAAFYRI